MPKILPPAALTAIVEGDAYNMENEFACAFATFTGRPEWEVTDVLRDLIWRKTSHAQGRGKHVRALRHACESMLKWYLEADQYGHGSRDLINFVATHDPACVYAVLVGKGGVYNAS